MTSTLIVRDATLAINGDSFRADDPAEHLRTRIAAVAELDREFLEQCVSVLSASDGGEETDVEVLEALFVLGIGRPEVLADMGLNHVSIGRRLASRMEREDVPEASLAVLEFLLERDSENRGVQRDHAALMRRLGMVQDLVERHLGNARRLMASGKNSEAIEILREVLLLDRTRKDVARTIRDLRFSDIERKKKRRRMGRKFLLAVLGLVSVFGLALRESHLRGEYDKLSVNDGRTVEIVRARLDRVEGFVDRNPIWLGSFDALNERSRLRVELDRLVLERDEDRERRDLELERSREEAAWARERGRMRARSEDFESAIAEFQRALELGGDDWSHTDQIERDIQALQQALEDRR